MLLESIRNLPQQHDSDCLIACCQQVLRSLGIEKSDAWLRNLLVAQSGDVTPFSNVQKLEQALGIVVELHRDGTVADFVSTIESGLPLLEAVDTNDPLYWPYCGDHAVVVIGFDDEHVYVNDPAQSETGLAIGLLEFQLAWSFRDYQYAVIRLT